MSSITTAALCVGLIAAVALLISFVYGLQFNRFDGHGKSILRLIPKKTDTGCFTEWKQVIAVGDLHGDYENFILLFKGLSLIDKDNQWIAKPKTLVVQTGDIADRGADVYLIFAELRRLRVAAHKAGSKIVQLLGNHETMNLCGQYEYLHPDESVMDSEDLRQQRNYDWSANAPLGNDIRDNFHVAYKVDGIVFVHAGMVPKHAQYGFTELKERLFDQIDKKHCAKTRIRWHNVDQMLPEEGDDISKEDVLSVNGPLWSRVFTDTPETIICPILDESLRLLNANVMVVGHTPQNQITTRCDNKIILVDTGISKYVDNNPRALLFDDMCTAWEVYVDRKDDKDDLNSSSSGQVRKKRLFTIPRR